MTSTETERRSDAETNETPLARAKREGAERDVLKAALDWYTAVEKARSDSLVPKEEAALFAAARQLGRYPEPGAAPDVRYVQPREARPEDARRPALIGICQVWVKWVRLLGYVAGAIEPGTVGDMEIIETSVDARVIKARFYPRGEGFHGFGLVTWPEWEYCREGAA